MEIERKYLIRDIPFHYENYPCHSIQQGYLCTDPVVRVRKEDDSYWLTYKSKGFMEREEYNLPLTQTSYHHMLNKADGNIITKKRYKIPLSPDSDLIIELDVFEGKFFGLMLAEVEFPSVQDANSFTPPSWFGEDVTFIADYQNNTLSRL